MAESLKTLSSKRTVEIDELKDMLEHYIKSRASVSADKVINIINKMKLGFDDLKSVSDLIKGRMSVFDSQKYTREKESYHELLEKLSNMMKMKKVIRTVRMEVIDIIEEPVAIKETPVTKKDASAIPAARQKMTRADVLKKIDEMRAEAEEKEPMKSKDKIELQDEAIDVRGLNLSASLSHNSLEAFKLFCELEDLNKKKEKDGGYIVTKKELHTLKGYIGRMKDELEGKISQEKFKILINLNSRISNITNRNPKIPFERISKDLDKMELILSETKSK